MSNEIGKRVLVLKGAWGWPCGLVKLVDVEGTIVEINPKDNCHKYKIKLDSGGHIFTNNKPNTGDYLFKKLKPKK